jgi:hypothetical protein
MHPRRRVGGGRPAACGECGERFVPDQVIGGRKRQRVVTRNCPKCRKKEKAEKVAKKLKKEST